MLPAAKHTQSCLARRIEWSAWLNLGACKVYMHQAATNEEVKEYRSHSCGALAPAVCAVMAVVKEQDICWAGMRCCCPLLFCACAVQPVDPKADPQAIEARHLLARKQQLLDPEQGTLKK